ncbi:J domain-containing protein [bacterium]|nr:J domain-containing protein [bacterium]
MQSPPHLPTTLALMPKAAAEQKIEQFMTSLQTMQTANEAFVDALATLALPAIQKQWLALLPQSQLVDRQIAVVYERRRQKVYQFLFLGNASLRFAPKKGSLVMPRFNHQLADDYSRRGKIQYPTLTIDPRYETDVVSVAERHQALKQLFQRLNTHTKLTDTKALVNSVILLMSHQQFSGMRMMSNDAAGVLVSLAWDGSLIVSTAALKKLRARLMMASCLCAQMEYRTGPNENTTFECLTLVQASDLALCVASTIQDVIASNCLVPNRLPSTAYLKSVVQVQEEWVKYVQTYQQKMGQVYLQFEAKMKAIQQQFGGPTQGPTMGQQIASANQIFTRHVAKFSKQLLWLFDETYRRTYVDKVLRETSTYSLTVKLEQCRARFYAIIRGFFSCRSCKNYMMTEEATQYCGKCPKRCTETTAGEDYQPCKDCKKACTIASKNCNECKLLAFKNMQEWSVLCKQLLKALGDIGAQAQQLLDTYDAKKEKTRQARNRYIASMRFAKHLRSYRYVWQRFAYNVRHKEEMFGSYGWVARQIGHDLGMKAAERLHNSYDVMLNKKSTKEFPFLLPPMTAVEEWQRYDFRILYDDYRVYTDDWLGLKMSFPWTLETKIVLKSGYPFETMTQRHREHLHKHLTVKFVNRVDDFKQRMFLEAVVEGMTSKNTVPFYMSGILHALRRSLLQIVEDRNIYPTNTNIRMIVTMLKEYASEYFKLIVRPHGHMYPRDFRNDAVDAYFLAMSVRQLLRKDPRPTVNHEILQRWASLVKATPSINRILGRHVMKNPNPNSGEKYIPKQTDDYVVEGSVRNTYQRIYMGPVPDDDDYFKIFAYEDPTNKHHVRTGTMYRLTANASQDDAAKSGNTHWQAYYGWRFRQHHQKVVKGWFDAWFDKKEFAERYREQEIARVLRLRQSKLFHKIPTWVTEADLLRVTRANTEHKALPASQTSAGHGSHRSQQSHSQPRGQQHSSRSGYDHHAPQPPPVIMKKSFCDEFCEPGEKVVKCYRRNALKYHPDREFAKGNTANKDVFQRVSDGYTAAKKSGKKVCGKGSLAGGKITQTKRRQVRKARLRRSARLKQRGKQHLKKRVKQRAKRRSN